MARIEHVIEDNAIIFAQEKGWRVRKYVQPGKRGGFDRVFIKDGRTVWIEFKDPDGSLSDLQVLEWKDLLDHGAEAYVHESEYFSMRILHDPVPELIALEMREAKKECHNVMEKRGLHSE